MNFCWIGIQPLKDEKTLTNQLKQLVERLAIEQNIVEPSQKDRKVMMGCGVSWEH